MERKETAKYKILRYMLNSQTTTRAELARELQLSMPTVISNVNEMLEKDLVTEVGEMESNGGRKAKALGLKKDYCFALGVNITSMHIGIVLLNLTGDIVKQERIRWKFSKEMAYCSHLRDYIQKFLKENMISENLLGIGIALPGIINQEEKLLVKSHALKVENYSLRMLEQFLPYPVYFENDANAAMLAEDPENLKNVVYLSLNNTLGGGIYINGELYNGQYRKAGEFGHMILYPNGKKCYCGKKGCADAYCAAAVLTNNGQESLEKFMDSIDQNPEAADFWEEYLNNLALLISNLRMAFDTDIILGGDVGGYLKDDLFPLREKLFSYNLFDTDAGYVKPCTYKKEASAVGAAKYFMHRFIEQII